MRISRVSAAIFTLGLAATIALITTTGGGLVAGEQTTNDYVSVDSEYPHPTADSQAVQVEVEIEPEGSEIRNLTVDISDSNKGFVDYTSFNSSKNPATMSVDVDYLEDSPEEGQFRIEPGLEPGQQVTIVFKTYPRRIDQRELTVAEVEAEYIQNGQRLNEEDNVRANLSASPHFQLQSAEEKVNSLQTQIEGMWLATGGGIVFGLLGILAAGGLYYRMRNLRSSIGADIASRIAEIKESEVGDRQAKMKLERLIEELGGEGSSPPGEPPGGEGPSEDDDPPIGD